MKAKTDFTILGVGCVAVLVFMVLWSLVLAVILMLAWNIVMPYLFDLPMINFIQAWALMFIANIFLGIVRSIVNVNNNK